MKRSLAKHDDLITDLTDKIEKLSAQLKQIDERYAQLSNSVDQQASLLTEHSELIKDLRERLNNLGDVIFNLFTYFAERDGDVSALQTHVNAHLAEHDQQASQLTRHHELIEDLRARLNDLGDVIFNMFTYFAERDDDISALQAHVNAHVDEHGQQAAQLTLKLKDLIARLNNLGDVISNVFTYFAELDGDVSARWTHINVQCEELSEALHKFANRLDEQEDRLFNIEKSGKFM